MALLNFDGSPHGGLHKLLPEWNSQPRIDSDFIVDHSIVGSAAGAFFMFRDSTGIESHFIIPKTGVIWQLMDTGRQADANLEANAAGGISIETEDNGDPNTDPWTKAQLDSLIWLHDKLARVHGIERRKCPVTNVASAWKGLGYHTLQGAPGPWTPSAGKTCPGKPVRVGQWNDILLPAFISGGLPPTEEDEFMSFLDLPVAEQDKIIDRFAMRIFRGEKVDGTTPPHLAAASLADAQVGLHRKVDLLWRGTTPGTGESGDTHDNTSVEGAHRKLDDLEEQIKQLHADLPIAVADELARRQQG